MPKYHHAGFRNGVIRCQITLCSGLTAPPSPRLPGSCTGGLRRPALGPPLNAPFGAFKALPGPFGLGWGWAGPGRPRGVSRWGGGPGHPRRPSEVKIYQKPKFSGGVQCAKISPCRIPERCYTVSNGTLQWSDGAAQPPVARLLHLGPSEACLGPAVKCSIWRV